MGRPDATLQPGLVLKTNHGNVFANIFRVPQRNLVLYFVCIKVKESASSDPEASKFADLAGARKGLIDLQILVCRFLKFCDDFGVNRKQVRSSIWFFGS